MRPMASSRTSPVSDDSAYLDGLRLLARRELSEFQVRLRLSRRGYAAGAMDAAISRLKAEGALDDERTARAIARTEVGQRGRGKLRVKRSIEAAGIASHLAQQAIDKVFEDLDTEQLLERALARKLRGRSPGAHGPDMRRLYRYLVGQGFEATQVLTLLQRRLKAIQNHDEQGDS
jgi:regulatory protein